MNNKGWRRWTALVPGSLALVLVSLAASAHAQTYPALEAYVGFTVHNNSYGQGRQNSPEVILNFGHAQPGTYAP